MGVKVTNNGFGTLSAGINSSATTVTVDSGQGGRFPALSSGDFFFATLIDTSNNLEIIKVTARSTDSMTVLRAQDSTSARAFSIGDRIELRPTAALFENAHLDNTPTSTGSFGLPKGTTAQQPTASATEGHIRYDTDDDVVYFSNGTNWIKISAPTPTVTSISGSIINGSASNIVLTGTDFGTANLQVKFTPSGGSTSTVTVTPSSATNSGNVAVPSAIYGEAAGTVVSVLVTSSDGVASTSTNMTVAGFATGGDTILSSGTTRTHIFKNTGTFVAPQNITSVDFLVVAGGGQGGNYFRGGGGGAGGVRSTLGQTGGGGSLESKITLAQGNHTITVGTGGTGGSGTVNPGSNGGNSSIGSQIVSTGGGGGGTYSQQNGQAGGSGGGGAGSASNTSGGNGAGTSGQGFAGGATSTSTSVQLGGGGGGAGEAGKRGGNSSDLSGQCGFGGDGVYSTIISTSDASSQSVGEVDSSYVYFGGGGSGSGYGDGNPNVANSNAGGLGGGAKGFKQDNPYINGLAGDNNTGGGGSGSSGPPQSGGNGTGGNGGSGVVIIKYTLS